MTDGLLMQLLKRVEDLESENQLVQTKCEKGDHVTIPVVSTDPAGLYFATTCCDRLFRIAMQGAVLGLYEVEVDKKTLDEIRSNG